MTNQSPEGLADDPMMQAFIGTVEKIDPNAAKQMPEALAEDDGKLARWLDIFRETFALRNHTGAGDALRSAAACVVNWDLTDVEVEAALTSEGIHVWGPDGERFERMFAVVMKMRAETLDNHLSRTPDREPFDRKAVLEALDDAAGTLAAVRATASGDDWDGKETARHFHDLCGETLLRISAAKASLSTKDGEQGEAE